MKYTKAYLTFAAALSLVSVGPGRCRAARAAIKGASHFVFESHPKDGVSVITNAARNVENMATR